MGLLDFLRGKNTSDKRSLQNLPAAKAAFIREKLVDCEVPNDPRTIVPHLAEASLRSLFGVQACKASHIGRPFFGMHVTSEEAQHVFEGIEVDATLESWRRVLAEQHGDAGAAFFGEVAQSLGIEVQGVTPRRGRRRLTFKAEPDIERDTIPPDGLFQAVLDDIEDVDALLVYADMLQEKGEALGEFITLSHAAEHDAALSSKRDRYLVDHSSELLGELSQFMIGTKIPTEVMEVSWSMGAICAARISATDEFIPEALPALLSAPVTRFLRELTLGMQGEEVDYGDAIESISETGPHWAMRTLHIGDFEYPDEMEMSWALIGDASSIWEACPALRELTLQGAEIELGKIRAPELSRVSLRTGGLPNEALLSIIEADLPKLEELEVWFGDDGYGAESSVDDVVPLLTRTDLPNLKCLRLMNSEFTDKLVEALIGSPLLAQIETLDLSLGTMTSVGAQRVLDNLESFAHLAEINVHDNGIGETALRELQLALPSVIGEQDGEYTEHDRYVSVGE